MFVLSKRPDSGSRLAKRVCVFLFGLILRLKAVRRRYSNRGYKKKSSNYFQFKNWDKTSLVSFMNRACVHITQTWLCSGAKSLSWDEGRECLVFIKTSRRHTGKAQIPLSHKQMTIKPTIHQ